MIRIRHPQGVSTLKLDSTLTLSSLQRQIQDLSGIPPNEQELKTGYPPRSLALHDVSSSTPVGEPPLGLTKGEQVLVSQREGGAARSEVTGSGNATPAAQHKESSNAATTSAPKVPSIHPSKPATTAARPSAPNPAPDLAPPSSSSSTPPTGPIKDGQVAVDYQGSSLTLKVVPDDNSCLFASVGLITEQRIDADVCSKLRKAVADEITSHPLDWPEAMLGHAPSTYVSKILLPKTWGGAIELSILAKRLRVQLHAIDVGSGVVHRFGEGEGHEGGEGMKGYLVYSGIHYDALALLPSPDAPLEFGATLFPTTGPEAEESERAALKLVEELRKRRYYTDTATFALKCNRCGQRLEGEKQAQEHAIKTGHADFGEV